MEISARWEVDESPVIAAYATAVPLDLTRDFFPFGERPVSTTSSTWPATALAIPGSSVALNVTLTNPASGRSNRSLPRVNKTGQPVLKWEYWNGRQWAELVVRDETEGLTENGADALHPPRVDGEGLGERRGTLLDSGPPGGRELRSSDERMEFSDGGPIAAFPPTLAPPSIQSITCTSWSSAGPAGPEAIVTHNNLVLDDIESGAEFAPFQRARAIGTRRCTWASGCRTRARPNALWPRPRPVLPSGIGQPDFDTWIRPIRVADHTGNECA